MLRRLLVALFAISSGLLFSGAIARAEPVFPPGLRVGLEPPGDMTVSRRFSGFEDPDRKAAITILDLPARAFPDLQRSAFATDQNGVTGLKRETFPFGSGIGLLVSGNSEENGITVHKWFLLATAVGGRVADLATLVSAQVPADALTVYSDAAIRKALASVTFRPTPVEEQIALLPFQLNDMAGFRVVQVLPGGIVLADGPGDDVGQQPHMIVTAGPGAPTETDERARFARDLLAAAPLRNLRIQGSEPLRITGAQGHEIRAQAEGARSGQVSLVQWVRFSGTGFLRIVGITPTENWDALFTRFRAVRDGAALR